jgi:glycosyltransferase involved in cell wall biosynthesis
MVEKTFSKPTMKIAHVNTHTYGGAGIAAIRIHQALRKIDVDSRLITKFGIPTSSISHHYFYKNAKLRYLAKKILSKPGLYPIAKWLQSLRPHPNLAGKEPSLEIFSPLTLKDISSYDAFENVDIIHLHWINDFIPYSTFFNRLSAKKFVWTLHDMNPITGGCHYSDGCVKFESNCLSCPQLKNTVDENYSNTVLEKKIEALSCLRDDQLIITAPSNWLINLSKKSKITKRFRHEVILNPSFDDIKIPDSIASLRQNLNLPLNKKIVLFAADNLKAPRKGIDFLFQALRLVRQRDDILLLGIGHKTSSPEDLHVTYTGSISNSKMLAKYYYASDCFITPTLADNSPLVVIESLSCGTPVLASNVGGLTDLVNSTNGILFPAKDIVQMAKVIEEALFHKVFDRKNIQLESQKKYSPSKIAHSYMALYESLIQ